MTEAVIAAYIRRALGRTLQEPDIDDAILDEREPEEIALPELILGMEVRQQTRQ